MEIDSGTVLVNFYFCVYMFIDMCVSTHTHLSHRVEVQENEGTRRSVSDSTTQKVVESQRVFLADGRRSPSVGCCSGRGEVTFP